MLFCSLKAVTVCFCCPVKRAIYPQLGVVVQIDTPLNKSVVRTLRLAYLALIMITNEYAVIVE